MEFFRSPHLLSRSFAEEVLLASPASGHIDRLEGVAATVWDLLEQPSDLDHLVGRLGPLFDAPRGQIERDVASLVRELVERRWLLASEDTDD